jgi:uncharacterized membrane protein HdeD (DUF308 family)
MEKMETKLFKNWWLLAIKGFLTLFFGFTLLILPSLNRVEIIKIFASIISASGLLLIFGTYFNFKNDLPWRWWLIEGLYDLIIGMAIFFVLSQHKLAAMAMFTEIIALWALVFGIIQIITAFRFQRYSVGWFAMLSSGLLAIAYTIIIFMSILPGADAKTIAIGYFAIFLGFVIFLNAIKLRKVSSKEES